MKATRVVGLVAGQLRRRFRRAPDRSKVLPHHKAAPSHRELLLAGLVDRLGAAGGACCGGHGAQAQASRPHTGRG